MQIIKIEGHSVGSKDSVETTDKHTHKQTDGQTDRQTRLIANSVRYAFDQCTTLCSSMAAIFASATKIHIIRHHLIIVICSPDEPLDMHYDLHKWQTRVLCDE